MKLGFIGYGNMAGAIIGGILKAGLAEPKDIYITEKNEEKLAHAKENGFYVSALKDVVKNVDLLFLSVKPNNFTDVLPLIIDDANKTTYVSIAAGISIATIQQHLGAHAAIIRTMPNTPLLVGKGTTAICQNGLVQEETYEAVKNIFASAGTIYELPESCFDEVLNLNGSSPAYIYLFAKTIAEYAANHGIEYNTAIQMIADTLQGSAEMLLNAGKGPDELIKNVCSPGGTTMAALEAMVENGFVSSVESGCEACVKRSKELAKS